MRGKIAETSTSYLGRPHSKSLNGAPNGNGNFPPPKTDKPRPHICGTCARSFARLEHLKRHERSHTKEKPFECPECTRCFARRDLLLRHQQKLHMTATPASRAKGGRRESTSSTAASGSGRVRKNSVVSSAVAGSGGSGSGWMRPRANTISHVDHATLGMIAAANSSAARHGGLGMAHDHHTSLSGLPGPGGYEFRGMSTAPGHHGNRHGLPKLETNGLNIDVGAGLRTAPPYGGLGTDFDIDDMIFSPASTINPAQLHFTDSPSALTFESPTSPYQQIFSGLPLDQSRIDDDGNFEWIHGFDNQMSFDNPNDQAIEGSSPSAISTTSHSGISEVMLDGSSGPPYTAGLWQTSLMSQAPMTTAYSMDLSNSTFPDVLPLENTSPKTMQGQNGAADQYYTTPPPLTLQSPLSLVHGLPSHFFHPPIVGNSDTLSSSSASVSGSNRHSSVTSVSTDSITDATRQALLTTLSQPSVFGHNHRKYSQPTMSSPLSSAFATRPRSVSSASLPSTYDLQRYVAAYIQYFHPHLPFLHLPSLSFTSPVYTSNLRGLNGHNSFSQSGIAGGGGCLVLAMAAIGALYEFEVAAAKDLFELAKKMIQLYLEERRKADMAAALNGSNSASENPVQNTPLWLVQAMLLNLIYGHNCGDKTSADIANTHCAALVSLARAAELARPLAPGTYPPNESMQNLNRFSGSEDIRMTDDSMSPEEWNSSASAQHDMPDEQAEWYNWRLVEERKRTLYAVFVLSSLLVSAYNHAPALTNSEIRLDLPCDEELWAVDSAEAWHALGGPVIAEQNLTPFASALSSLLTASQRHQFRQTHRSQSHHQPFGSGLSPEDLPDSDLKPSTFGCFILINALHNYIWETRQRHLGLRWTTQETEAMHAHIEAALRAWRAAWASNPKHSLERPNPFGAGPLSADSIPLLDLAYVRLFVNLGRSKEAFWQRDFDGMTDELARGAEIVQHAEHSPTSSPSTTSTSASASTDGNSPALDSHHIKSEQEPASADHGVQQSGQSSKRERHLRKAALYAADSLLMSDKLGVSFTDFNSRELPIQSAMCTFDCAQVLAEWASTVQERVGRYLGILGKDNIDYGQVPAIMLLEDEDFKLLDKISEILRNAEMKMAIGNGAMNAMTTMAAVQGLPNVNDGGFGSKILIVTAYMLERDAVWPGESHHISNQSHDAKHFAVTRLMARSLAIQAAHMKGRAESSVLKVE